MRRRCSPTTVAVLVGCCVAVMPVLGDHAAAGGAQPDPAGSRARTCQEVVALAFMPSHPDGTLPLAAIPPHVWQPPPAGDTWVGATAGGIAQGLLRRLGLYVVHRAMLL